MSNRRFLEKILVPIDGSISSVMAQETAAIIAKKTSAAVTVFHVVQEFEPSYHLLRSIQDELIENIQQHAKQIVDSALALFNEEKVRANSEITRSSDPASRILGSSKNYDIIIMGAVGENEKSQNVLGSVAKKVLRHTTCPILIVKKVSSLSNMLVCVDGSEYAIKAFEYAADLAEKLGSEITLLNVQERRLHAASPRIAEEIGKKILSAAMDSVVERRLKISKKLEFGVSSDVIVDIAEKENHDLLVLSSRGLGSVSRFFFGSVSDDVTCKAKSSVLIVPAKT